MKENIEIFTRTGFKWYRYIWGQLAIKTTRADEVYITFDGTEFKNANDIEDWIIREAEQIKNERMRSIIENLSNHS